MTEGTTDGVVTFDVEKALATARETVGEEAVLICVAYDESAFTTVHVDERFDALYPGAGARREHFGEIHSYVHLDFIERELFTELFLQPGRVKAFVTYMNALIAIRIVTGGEGLFLGIAPGTETTELVERVESVLRE